MGLACSRWISPCTGGGIVWTGHKCLNRVRTSRLRKEAERYRARGSATRKVGDSERLAKGEAFSQFSSA